MTTNVVEAKRGVAYWTAYQPPDGDTRPIDPLGFDLYAERLGNQLLPGITSRTNRIRYLGMVCAGLLLTAEGAASSKRRVSSARRDAFLPFERGWALAVCHFAEGKLKEVRSETGRPALKYEFRGLRGANHVLGYWREQNGARRGRVHPTKYMLLRGQSAQGGLGSYLVTLDHAGYVDRRNLSLREPGRQLAAAFLGDEAQRARRLAATDAQTWDMLWRLGSGLDLRKPSNEERSILRRDIFNTRGGALADSVKGFGVTPLDAESALKRLAGATDQALAPTARYTVAFDPLRRAALDAFNALGRAMEVDGELAVSAIPEDAANAAATTTRAASALMAAHPPKGMEAVQGLAGRLAATRGPLATLDEIVAWHHQHRVPWLSRQGDRFVLGRRGNFSGNAGFHGYTVPSYYSLVEDLAIRKPRQQAGSK